MNQNGEGSAKILEGPGFHYESSEVLRSLRTGDPTPPERYGDSPRAIEAWAFARRKLMAEFIVATLTRTNAALLFNVPDSVVATLAATKSGKPQRIEVAVPDHLVENLSAEDAERDLVVMVTVPAELIQQVTSPIIQPGGGG